MRERAGATVPDAMRMRFHAQTAGSTLTAQQPENNIVRTALQALAAVLGGTQSLHTNSFDEALGLPTDESVRLALRTQQVIAHESGVADTIDPLAGSYAIEALTDRLESEAMRIIGRVDARGGAVAALEQGFVQAQIADSAYEEAKRVEAGESVVVGVNRYQDAMATEVPVLEVSRALEPEQIRRLTAWKESRQAEAVAAALTGLRETAAGTGNVLPPMKQALAAGATVGEVSGALSEVFGRYRPTS